MDQASSLVLPWEKHLSAMEALVEVLFDLYKQTTVVCINGTHKKHSCLQRHDFTALLKLCLAVYTYIYTYQNCTKSTSEKLNENIFLGDLGGCPQIPLHLHASLKHS